MFRHGVVVFIKIAGQQIKRFVNADEAWPFQIPVGLLGQQGKINAFRQSGV